jgi:hypothetical protein
MTRNVFAALSKYGSAAEENYLTEALAFLLRTLLERRPDRGIELMRWLCGLSALDDPQAISVSTQSSVEEGRPDLEIRQRGVALAYVEIKPDAPRGAGQLEAYAAALARSSDPVTQLVLLTRSRSAAQQTTLAPERYHHLCWYDVHDRLGQIASADDELTRYFITAFRDFLRPKGMAMQRVDWQYIGGVPALHNLIQMLEAALVEAVPGVPLRRTAGWSWYGFYLPGGLWCGVRYGDHLRVMVENNNGQSPTYTRAFDLERERFFALDQGEQFEALVRFARGALESMLTAAGVGSGDSGPSHDSEEPGPGHDDGPAAQPITPTPEIHGSGPR